MTDVAMLYQAVAHRFDRDRHAFIGEDRYLCAVAAKLAAGAAVLDIGCGTGRPIAEFFIARGFALTGVDAAPAMIDICRSRRPDAVWLLGDMRELALGRCFDALIAWDSFFHLAADDQRKMFAVFAAHAAADALLLFTSGPAAGEAIGDLYGSALYHASLSPEEYRMLLAETGFTVVRFNPQDPLCGGHTVWLAQKKSAVE